MCFAAQYVKYLFKEILGGIRIDGFTGLGSGLWPTGAEDLPSILEEREVRLATLIHTFYYFTDSSPLYARFLLQRPCWIICRLSLDRFLSQIRKV